jgi:diaminopimelate decarboxylase
MNALWAFGDEECRELAGSRETPLFAYRGAVAKASYTALRTALPDRVRMAYAVKANSHPELLRCFAGLGASFDCASIGELRRIQELQLQPGRVFFAGPGKRSAELALALQMGVRVQAEGWEDLARLDALASAEIAVNLRIHPLAGALETNRIIGGVGPSAFGIDEEQLPEILERAKGLRHVKIQGLHVFAASNQRNAQTLLDTHDMVLELGRRLQETHGVELQQIDLGGGLGVPYATNETPLDLSKFGAGLGERLQRHEWFRGELILEPGRFLAAPCGVYLARVIRVKESRGTRFAILEGGINHLLRPLLTGQPFPVKAIGKNGPIRPTTLAGPLCTSLDRLGEAQLPELEPGDLLAFGTTGAYGLSEGMTHFLSHPVPPEIWVD